MVSMLVFILERFPSESESESDITRFLQLALVAKNRAVASSCNGFQLLVFHVVPFLIQ